LALLEVEVGALTLVREATQKHQTDQTHNNIAHQRNKHMQVLPETAQLPTGFSSGFGASADEADASSAEVAAPVEADTYQQACTS
jgi:hypothetical protein